MNKIPNSISGNHVKLILDCFKDFSKIQNIKIEKELLESKLDVFSEKFYENLFDNFLYFYSINGTKKIDSNEQKYFIEEIVSVLDIIYETFPNIFLKNDFLKSVLIYLVYSLKETRVIRIEIVLKIFFKLFEFFPPKNNKRIIDEVKEFETNIVKLIIKLRNRFVGDSEINLEIPNSENLDFCSVIMYLIPVAESLPLYLKGFINYNGLSQERKFVIIKLFNYFRKINPFNEEVINFYLYQGYILYEIVSNNQNAAKINFNDFAKIKENRVRNNEAKKILKIAIQLLEKKNYESFNNELNKIYFDLENEPPQILDIFCQTENYYKDLFKQLRFYLTQYKKIENQKPCKIVNQNLSRVLWLNFCKLLLLYLSEDDIKQDNIKIIFYSIVHLFNPDIPENSLEFCEDVIPKFFSQCPHFSEILENQEIYAIIDDYKYYPNFSKKNTFTRTFINLLNKTILERKIVKEIKTKNAITNELNNIENCDEYIPFPLLQDYLKIYLPKEKFLEISYFQYNLYTFYQNCWQYLVDDMGAVEEELYFQNLRKIISADDFDHSNEIKNIINKSEFLELIYNIMTSPVMKDAYNRIYYWYSTNGEYDIDQETLDDIEKVPNFKKNSNLINNQPIIDYYNKFCESLKNQDISGINSPNIFIIMGLPFSIKGFTFRFLKIVINSEGIQLPSEHNKNIDENSKNKLLRAYLVFLIIHEQNHFMKRYFNQKKTNTLCNTPVIKSISEGGKQLIKLLFGDELINKNLNIEQANYILDMNNWKKKSVYEFKKGFLEIKTEDYGDKCITYLSSSNESICDHSKLHA